MTPLAGPDPTFRALEQRLLQAEVDQSLAELETLLADEFREFGSAGQVTTRAEILAARRGGVPVQLGLESFSAQPLAPDVWLTTYEAIARKAGLAEPSRSLRSSLWCWRDGRWQVVFHQGTRVPPA